MRPNPILMVFIFICFYLFISVVDYNFVSETMGVLQKSAGSAFLTGVSYFVVQTVGWYK